MKDLAAGGSPSRLLCLCAALLLITACVASSLSAQVLYGSLVGTVLDQSGAVIPNATVTIVNKATALTRETTTDAAGRYIFADVLPGMYDVKVTGQGFRPLTQTDVNITINTVTRVDARLEVGAITEAITVSGTATTIQTDKSDTTVELTTRVMTDLPLASYRNYQALMNFVPGATPAAFQNAVVDTPGRSLTTNVNGTNRNNNNTRVDGATNVFIWLPHHTLYNPPVEAIEAVNISTTSFDAEQGMAGGAAVTVATRSGTNDLRGVAYYFHDDQHLRARNFFLRTPDKPKSISNIAGATLGGPIRKDKLFYFGSYERTMLRSGVSGNYDVPTADQRLGDFSAYATTIYDPLSDPTGQSRQPFSGNRIPATRLSPIIQKILTIVPMPNGQGTLQNYAVAGSQSFDRDQYDLKVNWNPTTAQAVWGTYSRMDALVSGPAALGEAGGPGMGTRGTGDTTVNIFRIGSTRTFTPTFLVDSVFGYSRFDQTVFGPDHGKNWGSEIWGIPGTNDPIGPGAREVIDRCPATACYSGQPQINSGYTNWGNNDGWIPLFRNDRSYTYDVNLTKIQGAHELRWGFGLVRHHLDHWQPEVSDGPRGRIQFAADTTGMVGYTANYFNQFATTLLGLPSTYTKALQYLLMTNREWQFGWYFRDRWHATRKLTLNLGLRYEYYPLMTRKDRGIERWDPATNLVYLGGVGNVPMNVGITTSKKMFAPRIGFAYRLNDKTVVRSGYGITYDPLPFSRPLRGLYPASVGATFPRSGSYAWVNRLDEGIPPIPVPDISSGVIPLPSSVDMGPRSPWAGELHRGYIQSWNFTVERALPFDIVTSVAYVGTQTVHQLIDIDINAAPLGTGAAGRPLAATQNRRIGANMWDGWASGNYHAFQLSLNRQFSKGLLLKGAYTWSKAINLSDDDGWAGLPETNLYQYMDRNRARAGYHRAHMLVMGFVYELPFGPNRTWATTGPIRHILGGWQMNGGFSSYTGTPFTIRADGAELNAPGSNQTADQIKPEVQKLGGIGTNVPFFDPTAFAQPKGVRFGTTGRNTLTGPGIVNLDMSIFRTFSLTERLRMEFRAEAYNLSNTPHFNNPNTNVQNMTFNPDGSIKSLGNFLSITQANIKGGQEPGDERQIRFGLRFSF